MQTEPAKIDKAFADRTPIHDAMTRGIRRAMAVHKRLGNSVVVWRNGKVAWISADEISVDIEESENQTLSNFLTGWSIPPYPL